MMVTHFESVVTACVATVKLKGKATFIFLYDGIKLGFKRQGLPHLPPHSA